MTAGNYKKVLKQLKNKPVKMRKFLKHNEPKPRKFGINAKPCKICGRLGAHIGQYGLDVCRQCFREHAIRLGFRKYY